MLDAGCWMSSPIKYPASSIQHRSPRPFFHRTAKSKLSAMTANIAIAGQWRSSKSSGTFRAENPATQEQLPEEFPVSSWADCDAALDAASGAFAELNRSGPEPLVAFLDAYAAGIEKRTDDLVAIANAETA